MKNKNFFQKIGAGIKHHKGWTTVIVIVICVGGYYWYRTAKTANAEPQYVVSPAHIGTLQQTVAGTGQVSASNQTDIESLVSGTIESINVKVGQKVTAGQLIATIDSTNAAISLQNAKLALAKLTEPAKETDLSNANNSVNKSYNDAFDAASTAYLDLPAIMSGMKDLMYGQSGFLSDQQSSYLSSTARTYRDTAGTAYDAAVAQYANSLSEFKGVSRSSSYLDLDAILSGTYTTMKDVADAVTKAQNAITFIATYQPDYDPKNEASAAASVNTWASQANSDVSAIVNAENAIASAKNALTALQTGADPLDVQTAELNLQQAQQTYDNYFIRAPYEGVIGRIPVNVYGQAGGSTVIATIVGQQKIASISLNEVDAAKVKAGQPVMITFDAIDSFNATGTVEQIDQVGTVTQGVVSYAVKILIDTEDSRIKPGMSVNTTIITNQEDNVLLVPNSAIKTQGKISYVQTFDQATVMAALAKANGGSSALSTRGFGVRPGNGSSTASMGGGNGVNGGFGSSTTPFGSSTTPVGRGSGNFSSSTRGFNVTSGQARSGAGLSLTITSATAPQQVIVTIGDSDDTNTAILSGLSHGQFVVTRTIASGSASSASAPSILSSFGGRGGAGARPAGGGGGAVIRAGG